MVNENPVPSDFGTHFQIYCVGASLYFDGVVLQNILLGSYLHLPTDIPTHSFSFHNSFTLYSSIMNSIKNRDSENQKHRAFPLGEKMDMLRKLK